MNIERSQDTALALESWDFCKQQFSEATIQVQAANGTKHVICKSSADETWTCGSMGLVRERSSSSSQALQARAGKYDL